MGRNAGWLTAAAALAKSDDCEGVDMICLPEVPFNVEHFIEKVRVMQEKKPSIVIAVSEGVKLEDGRYVCELADDVHAVDAFGHKALTGTARYLANVVARNLDTKTRCIELSTLQRCAGHLTSRTDITEAYQVGGAAVKAAFEGVTGQMVALKRISNSPYQCTTELHPISEVANLEKKVAVGKLEKVHVFGNDYPTPDGTGVRDYIHVVDLVRGHACAIKKLETNCGLFICNLGTGKGYSVLDVIHAFEKACGKPIPYVIDARRPGDIAECYADPTKARNELGWVAEYGIEEMCADSWNWQKNNPDGYNTVK